MYSLHDLILPRLRHLAVLALISVLLSVFFVPIQNAFADQSVIISAVQITGGTGQANNDFIELFNPTSEPFNLNGYRLVKRSASGTGDVSIKSWSVDTFIPPYSFYLWANSDFAAISAVPDFATAATLADNNGVALRQGALDAGALIDSVAWGQTSNGFNVVTNENPGAGQSLVRTSLFGPEREFAVMPSAPRNSTMQQLPPVSEEEQGPLINDGSCSVDSSVAAKASEQIPLTITAQNTGTAPWTVPGYSLWGSFTQTATPILESVSPGGVTDIQALILAPSVTGQYSLEWQMSSGQEIFGSTCVTVLNVTAAESDPTVPPTSSEPTVRINEVLPNPEGEDSGTEKIELYNYGSASITITGWKLDDVAPADPLSSNVYVLPETIIPTGSYHTVVIPQGKFALNNSAGDVVSLFDATGNVRSTLTYPEGAAENVSYAYFDDGWKWVSSTFGNKNVEPESEEDPEEEEPDPVKIEVIINEIYPFPNSHEQEFVELYNTSAETASLDNVSIKIGERFKKLEGEIPGHGYAVLDEHHLPVQLRNSGQVITLVNGHDEIDSATYGHAKKGESYSRFEDGWLWTQKFTQAAANILVVPKTEAPHGSTASAASKKTASASKTASTKKATSSNSKPKVATAITPASKNDSEQGAVAAVTNNSSEPPAPTSKDASRYLGWLLLGTATVGGGMFGVYRYGFKEPWQV